MASLWGESPTVLWDYYYPPVAHIPRKSESDVYGVAITLRSSQKREKQIMENVMKNVRSTTKIMVKRLPFAG